MPTEKSMMTIKDFYIACRQYKKLHSSTSPDKPSKVGKKKKEGSGKEKKEKYDIRDKARGGMRLWRKKVVEGEDDDGDIYRKVSCSASDSNGSGREHTLEMIFYGLGDDATTKAAANCSCEFYLYACEVALWHEGSARIDEPIEMRTWSNGEEYTADGPNPRAIPIICKHIYAALLAGAAKWKARGMSIEDKRKLAAKEHRKAEREKQALQKKEREERKSKRDERKLKETVEKKIKTPPSTKKPKEPKKYATPPTTKWNRKK